MPILLVIKTTFLFSTMFSTKIPFDETDSKNLREYKYHAGAYTPLDTFLSKLADKLINWVPKCLSPNAITLIGLSCNLFGVVLLHLFGDEDSWRARLSFFISASMALFYMFMDFLDGKQARRLGCSSPLGQLFDHGCDSLNIHLVLYAVIKSLGVTNMRQIALLFGVCGFMFASFQIIEYYDDVLMFGLSFFGVSEAEVMSVLISLITSIFGVSFWQVPIPFYPSIRLCDCLVYAFIIGIGGCVFLKNVKYLFKGTTITEEDRGRKTIGYMDHVKRYVPLM